MQTGLSRRFDALMLDARAFYKSLLAYNAARE
jgi:hypothetical protein